MEISSLLYDLFFVVLGTYLCIYTLSYYKGWIKLDKKKEKIRQERIQKYNLLILICLWAIFIAQSVLIVMFLYDLDSFI